MITTVDPPPLCSSDTIRSSRWEGGSQLSTSPQRVTLDRPEELQGDTAGSGTAPSPADVGSAQRPLRLSPVRTTQGTEMEEADSTIGL